ncbi:hypothetical protein HDU96_006665 [Phlyctochytrium bullatum]|nr:hypothetical protein HDU96_006665 [Phlyctochytrium bullatum]
MGDTFLSAVKEVDENTSKDSLELPQIIPPRPRSRSFSSPSDYKLPGHGSDGPTAPSGGPSHLPGGLPQGRRQSLMVGSGRGGNSKLKYEISSEEDSLNNGRSLGAVIKTSDSSSINVDKSRRSFVSGSMGFEEDPTQAAARLPPMPPLPIEPPATTAVRTPAALQSPATPGSLPPYSSPTKSELGSKDGDMNGEGGADKEKRGGDTARKDTVKSVKEKEADTKPETKSSDRPATAKPGGAAGDPTPDTPPTAFTTLFMHPIDPKSKHYLAWSFIINTLHAIEIILVPLQLAWTEYFIHVGVVIAQILVDLIFLTDCYFSTRIIFKDEYGIVCKDGRMLRKRFLWQEVGIIKLLACLPVELVVFLPSFPVANYNSTELPFGYSAEVYSQYKNWAIVGFLKMLLKTPYKRIYSIVIPGVAMPISRLIKTMLILMLMGHYDACLFWFIDLILPPPARWVDYQNLIPSDPNSRFFTTQYLVSYLSALRSLVLHLRDVDLDAENVYVVFEFVFGILAYGTVFGNIHSIVEMLDNTAASNHAEEQHKFQMEWLKNYMREKRLLPDIQKMVTAHKELQWQKSKGMDESKMFDDLPRSVQQQIKNFLYLDLVQKVPIFQGTDANFQNLLCFKIRSVHVLDGWFIFRKGDEGDEMYFIKSGEVQICGENGVIFVTLSTGSFFGEIALFEACKRTAAAKAKGNVELCMLKKEDFVAIMDAYPHVAERIRETIRLRKEQEERVKAEKAREEEEAKRKQERSERLLRRRGSRASMFGGSRRSLDTNSHSVFNIISRNLSMRSKINSASQSVMASKSSMVSNGMLSPPQEGGGGLPGLLKSMSWARSGKGAAAPSDVAESDDELA